MPLPPSHRLLGILGILGENPSAPPPRFICTLTNLAHLTPSLGGMGGSLHGCAWGSSHGPAQGTVSCGCPRAGRPATGEHSLHHAHYGLDYRAIILLSSCVIHRSHPFSCLMAFGGPSLGRARGSQERAKAQPQDTGCCGEAFERLHPGSQARGEGVGLGSRGRPPSLVGATLPGPRALRLWRAPACSGQGHWGCTQVSENQLFDPNAYPIGVCVCVSF